MQTIKKEFDSAEIGGLMSAETYASYKVISEPPTTMKFKVVHTTEKEVTFWISEDVGPVLVVPRIKTGR